MFRKKGGVIMDNKEKLVKVLIEKMKKLEKIRIEKEQHKKSSATSQHRQ